MFLIIVNTRMKYTIVTTFNAAGYEKYGQRMIQTFLQNWPAEVQLVVYAEKCNVAESAPNLVIHDLESASPELVAFKNRWRGVPKANGDVTADPVRSQRRDAGKGFKWDAVRFSHKVYAVFAAARATSADWLLWMDADMVCHSPITIADIARMCPADRDICFLGRGKKFTECGLYAMNLNSKPVKNFLAKFKDMYDNAEAGIFMLDEWHDSFVFDAARRQCSLRELDWTGHQFRGEGHPLINSDWGRWLDHLKGDRKQLGRSKAKDLKVQRAETYWRM